MRGRTGRIIGIAALVVMAGIPTVPTLADQAVSTDKMADALAPPPKIGRDIDADGNGYPDAGKVVIGTYHETLYIDDFGQYVWYYFDHFSDRAGIYESGSVPDIEKLDPFTITQYEYLVEYLGDFGNTPYLDSGWIRITIKGSGFSDSGYYKYYIVSKNDPVTGGLDEWYAGDPKWAVWGDWEIFYMQSPDQPGIIVPPPIRPKFHMPLQNPG